MKSKVVVLYQNMTDKVCILDGECEQEERKIIERVSKATGASKAWVRKLVKIYKERLKNTYLADQLENYVLDAALRIRRIKP